MEETLTAKQCVEIKKKLEEAAMTGLDRSPGDSLAADALRLIQHYECALAIALSFR